MPTGTKEILTDALGKNTRKLEFDSVRPPRHESNYASLFRIRARGLEFEVGQCGFAQEQLTGPDPSGVPGSLIIIPSTNHKTVIYIGIFVQLWHILPVLFDTGKASIISTKEGT